MYQIIRSEKADLQYRKTLVFWNEHTGSSTYSEKIILEVEKREALISSNPLVGRIHNYRNVRRINFHKYFSLIYQIIEDQIYIIAFWDGRRNPKELKI